MRIAVGGFQHETNTFATHPATLADFVASDAWPGLVRGAELFDAVRDINLPAAGFIAAAHAARATMSCRSHANVSELMVRTADALVAYRSYPHIDMSEAGARALRCLIETNGVALAAARHEIPFLIPLTSQCTLVEPMAGLMQEVALAEHPPLHALNFTPGFPNADVEECGPSVFGYGTDSEALNATVARLATLIAERESQFALQAHSIASALREIARSPRPSGRPIVLADTQDNPGGGGETPLTGRFEVLALGDGKFVATGPFYRGSRMNLGPMALLRLGELHIAVSSRKQQAADQAMFRHLRVEPAEFGVLALKSSVHFRADFGPIASRILVVIAPGTNIADPSQLKFTKLQRRIVRS